MGRLKWIHERRVWGPGDRQAIFKVLDRVFGEFLPKRERHFDRTFTAAERFGGGRQANQGEKLEMDVGELPICSLC